MEKQKFCGVEIMTNTKLHSKTIKIQLKSGSKVEN